MRPAGGTGLPAGIFPVSALPFDPYRASVRLSRGVYVPVRSRQGPFLAFRSAHDSRHLQVPVQRFLQNGRADESARADQGDCFHNFGRLTICILRTAVRRPVRSNANLLPKRTKTLRFRSVLRAAVRRGAVAGSVLHWPDLRHGGDTRSGTPRNEEIICRVVFFIYICFNVSMLRHEVLNHSFQNK